MCFLHKSSGKNLVAYCVDIKAGIPTVYVHTKLDQYFILSLTVKQVLNYLKMVVFYVMIVKFQFYFCAKLMVTCQFYFCTQLKAPQYLIIS